MKILYDRVLVKPIIEENKTKSGIIIPTKNANKGIVVLLGEKTTILKVGYIVTYKGGIPLDYNNESHLLLSEQNDIITFESE